MEDNENPKPKPSIERNWDDDERESHGRKVSERFALKREEKIATAKILIDELIAAGITVTQNELARRTGFSVGFVNKHLREEIEKANKRYQEANRKSRMTRNVGTLEKEVERLTMINHKLRDEVEKQKKINKALLAQVATVTDLEATVKFLKKEKQELMAYYNASREKVIHLTLHKSDSTNDGKVEPASEPIIDDRTDDLPKSNSTGDEKVQTAFVDPIPDNQVHHQDESRTQTENVKDLIDRELSQLGITLNPTLKKTLKKAEDEEILYQIEHLKQKMSDGDIDNPSAWLNSAIKNKYRKPSAVTKTAPSPAPEDEKLTTVTESEGENVLVSPDKLKVITKILQRKYDAQDTFTER